MNNEQLVRRSKFLSLVLRHKPETIGLTLDKNGWVDTNTLLAALKTAGKPLSMSELETIVAENNKKRFAFNDNKSRIRASQGHSLNVDLAYKPSTPPAILYHGTATSFLGSILRLGIQKRNRHHVHLSADKGTARNVGQRHGKPVILKIDAKEMVATGHEFFLSENGVWLTDFVAPKFVSVEEY